MKTKVFLKDTDTEYTGKVTKDIKTMLDEDSSVIKKIDDFPHVILKPNIVWNYDHTFKTTNGKVLLAIAEFIKDIFPRKKVMIMEGSNSYVSMEHLLASTGITPEDIKRLDLSVRDIRSESEFREIDVSSPLFFDKMSFSPYLVDGYLISVPKLKTHARTAFTLGCKNMVGSTPVEVYGNFMEGHKNKRLRLHEGNRVQPWGDKIHYSIADIVSAIRPNYAVLDGVHGCEGNEPWKETPRKYGIIGCSSDVVALDSAVVRLFGKDPRKVLHLNLLGLKGTGKINEEDIELIGGAKERSILMPEYDESFVRKYFCFGDKRFILKPVYPHPSFKSLDEHKNFFNELKMM